MLAQLGACFDEPHPVAAKPAMSRRTLAIDAGVASALKRGCRFDATTFPAAVHAINRIAPGPLMRDLQNG
jgi:hypothetical protein